jgi:mono/diheme cytochrome c family protein
MTGGWRTSTSRTSGWRGWTIAVVGCMLWVLAGASVSAQTTGATKSHSPSSANGGGTSKTAATGPSTLSGVYTAAQAARGRDVYAGTCKSCHTPASHTGAMFKKWWVGKHLSDLYMFVGTNMPKNDPGSLTPEDAADVVAYLMQINGMPVGPAELPPDEDALKKYRIELKRTAKTSNKSSTSSRTSTVKRTTP